uniref:Si:ch211-180a12.2 n=1 Tax=Paramormyrops kingsleyae TaxID=1676925 RepID=A0A3B3RBZ7_9TELE
MKFKVLICFCLLTVIKHVSLTDIWAHPNSSVLLPCNVEADEIELNKNIFLLGVSWLHNGSVIASSGADGNRTEEGFSLEAGTLETGAFSLTLHSVSASKQGEYVCGISYNHTLLYSGSVTLCILGLPSLSIPSTVAVIDRPSRIECRAEHFTPPLIDFTWVRAGVVVKPPESITAVNRTSSGFFWAVSSLTLTPTEQDKDVNFSCVVKHTASEEPIVLNFHLNLIYLPTVTLSALPLTSQFSPVTLSCDIEGFYPEEISVSWFQNGSLVPDMPLAWPGPGGSFRTRRFYTLRAEDMRRGTEVQCAVRHPAVAESVSATMTLSATGPNAKEPVMTKSAKASVAVIIISLAMIFLLCFGFSWKKRDEKEKSLVVSGIILPPRVIVGQKGRVTISVEGRRVDRVQVTWFLNDIPISDTSKRAPTENEKNLLLPPNGKFGYYKLHTQYPIPSGNSRTMQLFSSVTFIPDIAVHKGGIFKCQISYKGKDQVVAEKVSDKLMLLGKKNMFCAYNITVSVKFYLCVESLPPISS